MLIQHAVGLAAAIERGIVGVAVDISGSRKTTPGGVEELSEIVQTLLAHQPTVTIAWFDNQVSTQIVNDPSQVRDRGGRFGGGGTSLKWMKGWLMDDIVPVPDVLVVLTDGEFSLDAEDKPGFDVCWFMPRGNMQFNPPFGQVF